MATLNEDLPIWDCMVRSEYLYDLESHHGLYTDVCVFGLASVYGRALGFHVLTQGGAQIARLPISSLVHKEHEPHLPLHYLELWDCFSYDFSVHKFSYLSEMRCKVILRDKQVHRGTYLFTVDWYGTNDAEEPGEDGHKNLHVVALDCGCYAAQSNNRVLFQEPSCGVSQFNLDKGERPDYLINSHKWKCEIDSKWATEDSNYYFYEDQGLESVDIKIGPGEQKELTRLRALRDVNWPTYKEECSLLSKKLGISAEDYIGK